jgi:hypothetical protein
MLVIQNIRNQKPEKMQGDGVVTIKWQELIEKDEDLNDNSKLESSSSVRGTKRAEVSDFTIQEDCLLESHVLCLLGSDGTVEQNI